MTITTKETMAMPGVKLPGGAYVLEGFESDGSPMYRIANESMKIYGQLGLALAAEINANAIEMGLLGRDLTQAEVATLLASSDGLVSIDGANRDLSEARALRIKAQSHLEKGVASQMAGE